jgi:DNA-binding NarL/FixJ family response regulator
MLNQLEHDLNNLSLENNVLKNIIAEIPCHVYWMDKNGVYLGCNNMQAELLGFSNPEQVIGRSLKDILANNNISIYQEFWNNYWRVLNGEIIECEEILIVDKNKSSVHVKDCCYALLMNKNKFVFLSKKRPLYNSEKQIIGMIGISIDIKDSKQKQILEIEKEKYLAKIQSQEIFKTCINTIQHELDLVKSEFFNNFDENKTVINKDDIRLTKREGEILYLLSLGHNPKQIANIFAKIELKKISPATISSVINKQLYVKFAVSDLGNLMRKARIMNKIPFLHDSFFVV